jgi:hypothetical protein
MPPRQSILPPPPTPYQTIPPIELSTSRRGESRDVNPQYIPEEEYLRRIDEFTKQTKPKQGRNEYIVGKDFLHQNQPPPPPPSVGSGSYLRPPRDC